ncbi:MAG: cyanate transporter [Klebsiella pneumoniae]|nr:cyanate transporter [Klebsiella pneumoniae]
MTPALRQNLTLAVLVLTGINMRPLLTSIGPLLPDIRAASGMSYTLAALLTALPVIAMGVLALAAGWVDRYIGQKRSIALSLLIIAAGALLREIAPNSGLLLTSALAGGIGIGIIQAAIPAVIKHLFPRRTPLVMGLWSAALMGGGGLGAAFTPWLASHSAAWHDALAWWALPALLALLSWLAICRHLPRAPHQTSASPRVAIIGQRRAWTLGLYFGLINLLLPALARQEDRRQLLLLALALQLIGFCGFIWLPEHFSALWAIACGVGLGGAFPLCLVLALDHAGQPAVAGRLVAFMQGIGFIIAGLSPWLSGLLRSLSGNYTLDWSWHAICVLLLMALTLRFIPAHYPAEWRQRASDLP